MSEIKEVKVTATIKTSPDKVIRAFTDHQLLHEWWGVEKSLIETKPGGVYTLVWNLAEQEIGYVSSGTVKEYKETEVLDLENMVYINASIPVLGPMSLTVLAREHPDGAEVTVTQSGYGEGTDWDWYYEEVKKAWPQVVDILKEYLEQGQ